MRSRDAFAGGFVAGIVEGKSLEESVDMGHWLASLSIRELGPSYVLALIVQQPSKNPLPNTVSSLS
jgi:adenosine kinase